MTDKNLNNTDNFWSTAYLAGFSKKPDDGFKLIIIFMISMIVTIIAIREYHNGKGSESISNYSNIENECNCNE